MTDARAARIDTLPYRVVGPAVMGEWMVTNAPEGVLADTELEGPFATKAAAQADADRRNAADEARADDVLRRIADDATEAEYG